MAQEGRHHRYLLLVLHSGDGALFPHRLADRRRRRAVSITTADGLIAFYENGHGPLATLPLAGQMIIFLVGEDFITYWTHRWFHGKQLWKYHAVHHSSEELEWISAARFHPINCSSAPWSPTSRCYHRHFAQCLRRARPDHHRPFGLRARQSRLEPWSVQIRDRLADLPPLAPHLAADRGGEKNFAATFPCSTSCLAHSICRPAN